MSDSFLRSARHSSYGCIFIEPWFAHKAIACITDRRQDLITTVFDAHNIRWKIGVEHSRVVIKFILTPRSAKVAKTILEKIGFTHEHNRIVNNVRNNYLFPRVR